MPQEVSWDIWATYQITSGETPWPKSLQMQTLVWSPKTLDYSPITSRLISQWEYSVSRYHHLKVLLDYLLRRQDCYPVYLFVTSVSEFSNRSYIHWDGCQECIWDRSVRSPYGGKVPVDVSLFPFSVFWWAVMLGPRIVMSFFFTAWVVFSKGTESNTSGREILYFVCNHHKVLHRILELDSST